MAAIEKNGEVAGKTAATVPAAAYVSPRTVRRPHLADLERSYGRLGWLDRFHCINLTKGMFMLGEALRLIRVFHDMKQQELVDLLGLSKSYISELESGKKTPSMEVIQKYSLAFDIPASAILLFSENLEDSPSAKRAKTAVAKKIMQFLQLIERKTGDG